MNNCFRVRDLKNIIATVFVVGFSIVGNLAAHASDNVLQAVQIEGNNDSYNIILRSDDKADLKKTVQAPNKLVLTLKGIRASKTLNTIYSNTASVDSVVVEPTGDDSVKVFVQAENVDKAEIKFDTLKTPLGVISKEKTQSNDNEIVLSEPISSYKPVYNDSIDNEEDTFSAILNSSTLKKIKKALKHEKVTVTIAVGMLSIFFLSAIKIIKGNDSDIKVGLSQSLRQRDMNLMKERELVNPPSLSARSIADERPVGFQNQLNSSIQTQSVPNTGMNYGLKAYQQGTKSPYMSSENSSRRSYAPQTVQPQAENPLQQAVKAINKKNGVSQVQQSVLQRPVSTPIQNASRPAASNIDSMKFLESMTKIYEKNGRSDLAQGLKSNIKKAKINMA